VLPFYKQLLYFTKTVELFYIVLKHISRVPTLSNKAWSDVSPQGHIPRTCNGQWLITVCVRKENEFIPGALPTFNLNQNMSNYHREMSDN
jgi:hypothetical protein